MSLRRLSVVVLTLAFVSCDALPSGTPNGPTGPVGDVASAVTSQVAAIASPSAVLADQPFENLLAKLDLAKTHGAGAAEILDQIRKTRSAVAAAARASSSRSSRLGLASVMRSVGTFSVPQFAAQLAFNLDGLTKKNASHSAPAKPYSNIETGVNSFTTTTLNITETFSGSRSVVTGTMIWSYSTITIETKTGATLVHLTDDRELVGTIDVCPGADGDVPGTINVSSKIVAQTAGVTTKRTSTGSSTFQGKVSEQASLQSVTQQHKVEAGWESSTGNGGYSASNSATWNAGASGYLGGLQTGSFTGTLVAKGSASAAEAAKAAGWDVALDAFALEQSYQKAQQLWRQGRCVVVVAPDYNAETPIDAHEQQRPQHDEEVDVSSETKFSVQLRHRFGGAVNAPTIAELTSGKEKLDPNQLGGSGGPLSYKAPDEEGKEATAQLTSTSKRGIGTLVLTFHTGGKQLTLSVQGTQELLMGPFALRSNVSIGPAQFQKVGDKWEARPPFTATSRLEPPDSDCPDLKITQSGTLMLGATIETRGNAKVWVVKFLGLGTSTVTGSGCPDGEEVTKTLPIGGGIGAGLFLGTVGDIVVPIDGGTVGLQGAQGNQRASGTATGTVTKKG